MCVCVCVCVLITARKRVASCKMKQIKANGSKETDDLDNEDNEELFGDIGVFIDMSDVHLNITSMVIWPVVRWQTDM